MNIFIRKIFEIFLKTVDLGNFYLDAGSWGEGGLAFKEMHKIDVTISYFIMALVFASSVFTGMQNINRKIGDPKRLDIR